MMTLLSFIVTIGILVTIHEYGHFQVARWCGIKVLRFSIGFGKPLLSKKMGQDQTEFVLAAIPLGGFVKMLDERELKAEREENPQDTHIEYAETDLKRAFNRQAVWKRILVVLAGPAANLLLAIALYWVLFMQGVAGVKPIIGEVEPNSLAAEASLKSGELIQKINGEPIKSWQEARWILLDLAIAAKPVSIETLNESTLVLHTLNFAGIDGDLEVDVLRRLGITEFEPAMPTIISDILPNSVAEKAGFKVGDEILHINDRPIATWQEMVNIIQQNPEKPLDFELLRQQRILKISATPAGITENGKRIGRLGASAKPKQEDIDKLLVQLHYSPMQSMQQAFSKTWKTATFTLKMLYQMVLGKVSVKSLSGPVSIADYAGKSASLGIKPFLEFLAFFSISIGVFNLLPIPVLDGGHLMYYMAEIFKGTPVSEKVLLMGQKIGFALLALLMSVAIFNDLNRYY